MLKASLTEFLFLFLFGGCLVLQVLAATCYHLDGTNAGPSNALCNPNATGTAGSHSACCNAENADACLSTGLCLNSLSRQQSHLLWATACTDPTFKDPSCPQYCHELKIDNAHLKSCNDSNYWCCEGDANILTTEECCNQAFQLSQPVGTVIAQLQSGIGAIPLATAAATSDSPSSPSSSASTTSSPENSDTIPAGAIAGLAVESVILAVTLAGLAFVIWRNRILTQKAKEAEEAAAAAKSAQEQQQQQMQQYHWQPPPSSHGGTLSQAYAYGSPVESEPPKRSELHSPGMGYPELPGEPIGTELPSDQRTSRSPTSPRSPFAQ
ncbi:hypothetical protein F4821DRAFT_96473 [Hypoxylon rubiginosum]|uniref:Uncharacterized protein n=1 Tax=Hypoxylon rubiginosum TaxID=110542 RepID=A0ACC0D5Y8_9PEZI|nr:hypothetical protein F4821DRAFT_96473 [Hypoxylon rubiginosum]